MTNNLGDTSLSRVVERLVAGGNFEVKHRQTDTSVSFQLTRKLAASSGRYLELNFSLSAQDEGLEPIFGVLYGEFGNADPKSNYDARTWGTLAFVEHFARAFLIELTEFASLPHHERGRKP